MVTESLFGTATFKMELNGLTCDPKILSTKKTGEHAVSPVLSHELEANTKSKPQNQSGQVSEGEGPNPHSFFHLILPCGPSEVQKEETKNTPKKVQKKELNRVL